MKTGLAVAAFAAAMMLGAMLPGLSARATANRQAAQAAAATHSANLILFRRGALDPRDLAGQHAASAEAFLSRL
ncbi:MAG TPA: hypothetical protein VNO70_01930, partial [Blastocatellia bacterium]|nr:hypothetical protein [Blastocatellia bacterium]